MNQSKKNGKPLKNATSTKKTDDTAVPANQDKEKIQKNRNEKSTAQQKDPLEKSQADLSQLNDKYLRLYSEFENFRRRAAKEKLALIENANENLLKALVPVIDDFERALIMAHKKEQAIEAMQEGIQLVYDKYLRILQKEGINTMKLEKGHAFNAELHEAVIQAPTQDPNLKGKVMDIVEKGYLLNNKVVRFAKVIIGS